MMNPCSMMPFPGKYNMRKRTGENICRPCEHTACESIRHQNVPVPRPSKPEGPRSRVPGDLRNGVVAAADVEVVS